MEEETFQFVVSDYDLVGAETGMDLLNRAKRKLPYATSLLVSGKSLPIEGHAVDFAFVEKPVTKSDLAKVLEPQLASAQRVDRTEREMGHSSH